MDRITLDPDVLVGKPVVKGTRLAVEYILELLDAGQSESEILDSYPGLMKEDILACLSYGSKDRSVTDLVKWLAKRLHRQLLIGDHWDADRTAIGVARPENPEQLVYISTSGHRPGKYFIELERASPLDSELPYQLVGRYREVDEENVPTIVEGHFSSHAE